MRRSRFVLLVAGLALACYLPFAWYGLRERWRKWFPPSYDELRTEGEPAIRGRPLHEWLADLSDEQPMVRRKAAETIGGAGKSFPRSHEVIEPLSALLRDSDPTVRVAAAEALSKVHYWARGALDRLLDAAGDGDPAVRASVLGP